MADNYWDNAAFGTTSPAETAEKPLSMWDKLFGGAINSLATLPKRAIDASAQDVQHLGEPDYQRQSIAPAVETAMTMTGGAGVVPAESNSLRMGIKAYHGSPHDFDKFDISRIGTGEGAQSYGHGLYFAENEGTAKSYRDALGGNANRYLSLSDAEKNLSYLKENLADPKWSGHIDPRYDADVLAQAEKEVEAARSRVPGGKMYEVNINADPERMLDWNKQLREHSPETQDAIKQAMGIDYYGKFDPQKAQKLWDTSKYSQAGTAIRQGHIAFSDEQVAHRLNEVGIPGIKYLDQVSRPARSIADTQESIKYYGDMLKNEPNNQFAADQLKLYRSDLAKHDTGSHNYVMFNDKLIDIIKKYGLAGIAPPAAAMSYDNLMRNNQ